MAVFRTSIFVIVWVVSLGSSLFGQRGFGFRFGSDFSHFFQGENFPVIDGGWSNVVIGPYYQAYFSNGGVQAGLNFLYKNDTNRGWPNLPLVQKDFNGSHNVGLSGAEFDLRVGPRFGFFNPKIGYRMGYRWVQRGMLEPGRTDKINPIYVGLPFIGTAEFPTEWGSVGFSAGYTVGLTNFIKNPNPNVPGWKGSHINSIDFELFLLFKSGKQKPR